MTRRLPSRRLPFLAAALVVAATATGSNAVAAPKPQIVDAAGDAKVPHPPLDIVSALYKTTGDTVTTIVKKKKVVTYTPRKLVVTLNLSGAPMTNPGVAYEVSSDVAGCGTVRFTYTPSTVFGQVLGDASIWVDCGEPDPTTGDTLLLMSNATFELGAKSITWTVNIKSLPKAVKVGAKLSGFRAAVDIVDPVFGLQGTPDTGTPIDEGIGAGSWALK